MGATVSNATVDTAADAVDAPWGPFVRVTDVTTLPTPNSEIRIEFTTALGHTVFMSYEELQYEAAAIVKAKAAAGFTADVELFKSGVDTQDTALTALTAPHTYAEYKARLAGLKGLIPQARGYL